MISFIYDAIGCYIYDGTEFKLAAYAGYKIEERAYLTDYISSSSTPASNNNFLNLRSIIVTDISKSERLGYVATDEEVYSTSPYSPPYGWAACVAMIANKFNDTSLTAEEVAHSYYGDDFNHALNMIGIVELLRTTYTGEHYSSSDITPTDEVIKRNIEGDYPIVGGFMVTGGYEKAHATVIYAIHMNYNYISLCDPECGRMFVYRDTIHEDQSSYGEYAYTAPNSGAWLYMISQASRFLE